MVDTDDTRRMTNDGRQTTPWVWHKLPTGELKILVFKTGYYISFEQKCKQMQWAEPVLTGSIFQNLG